MARYGLTHGDYRTKEYLTWQRIKIRCYRKIGDGYKYYGGKGITMCDRWRYSYENFLSDMGRAPSKEHSIERIHTDKNYEPGNCKWATILEQANNKDRTRKIEFRGEIKPISVWCRELNLNRKAIYHRIFFAKWDIERALTTPIK